ncbi:hypothetical protein CA85_05320 [Allorhodopirellula solitaria]|uniref:Uncharacterized protein n=1 Tax=Allorhodopirellula solitaria TaxID=2527987 RepID=A0A5C5YK08_9BACT|nr:hypothetical protein CA85_05320 [Allorhodopirellula solitaria]
MQTCCGWIGSTESVLRNGIRGGFGATDTVHFATAPNTPEVCYSGVCRGVFVHRVCGGILIRPVITSLTARLTLRPIAGSS